MVALTMRRSSSIFSPNRAGLLRRCAGWLVVAALALHGFIPLGYMPSVAPKSALPLAMTLCGGMSMSSLATDDTDHHNRHAGDKANGKTHQRCPFSINSVFAAASTDPQLAAPAYIFIGILALSAFALVASRRYGNAAPRAPPVSA
jgi:hypothetical protein